jgi:hypothetical protein
MNKRQSNQSDMLRALHQTLLKRAPTSNDAGVRAVFATFEPKYHRIEQLAQAQTRIIEGKTAQRKALLAAAADATLDVANRAYVHAIASRDCQLAALVRVLPSDLFLARILDRLQLMRRVHDAAAAVLPDLAGVGVTPEMVVTLFDQITVAEAFFSEPRQAANARKRVTQELRAAFSDMSEFLKHQLHPMMCAARRADPDLFAHYELARKVIHRGGRRAKKNPTIVDGAASESPLPAP